MSNLKKIDEAIKRVESAAKNAIIVLNAATDNAYADSPAVEEPLRFIHNITRELMATRGRLAENTQYEGMTPEEIEEKKAEEKKAAYAKLQLEAAAALDKLHEARNPKKVEEPIVEEPILEEVLSIPPAA